MSFCRICAVLFSLCFAPWVGHTQDIIGAGTRWVDSFREWDIRTVDEYRTGTLELRWSLSDDWSEWDFRLGDTTASIKLTWKDDPNLWQIDCLGTRVTARTKWRNDFREWRLSDGTHTLSWESKYSNVLEEWEVQNDRNGYFAMYTYWEGDPREWVVVDELDPDVSYAMRVAMTFLTLMHSAPRI